MLARVDAVNVDIAAVDIQIGDHLAPFADAAARLDEIPGIGPTAAATIIAEIGLDMSRFPDSGPPHLVGEVRARNSLLRWQDQEQRLLPDTATATLARVLGEAAVITGRTDTLPAPSP